MNLIELYRHLNLLLEQEEKIPKDVEGEEDGQKADNEDGENQAEPDKEAENEDEELGKQEKEETEETSDETKEMTDETKEMTEEEPDDEEPEPSTETQTLFHSETKIDPVPEEGTRFLGKEGDWVIKAVEIGKDNGSMRLENQETYDKIFMNYKEGKWRYTIKDKHKNKITLASPNYQSILKKLIDILDKGGELLEMKDNKTLRNIIKEEVKSYLREAIKKEEQLKEEIETFKRNEEIIEEKTAQIEDILDELKRLKGANVKRAKEIQKYMERFDIDRFKAGRWVAELEEELKYERPRPSYGKLWKDALSKVNDEAKEIMRKLEKTQMYYKNREMHKVLTITTEFSIKSIIQGFWKKIKGLVSSISGYSKAVKNLPRI